MGLPQAIRTKLLARKKKNTVMSLILFLIENTIRGCFFMIIFFCPAEEKRLPVTKWCRIMAGRSH